MGIILASSSPRRRELLSNAGLEFDIIPSDADETLPDNIDAESAVKYLASVKARDIFKNHPADTVIGADTVVVLDGKILGKPKNDKDAFDMLSSLSGRTHRVCTGVCILSPDSEQCFAEMTEVEFYPLSDKEIDDYVATGEPSDKAGAYGIQGKGCMLVKGIHGDYFNVVGLPVARVMRALKNI